MQSTIDPEKLFAELEADRRSGDLRKNVLWRGYSYQSSKTYKGFIEKVDEKGQILAVGKYENGGFVAIDVSKE